MHGRGQPPENLLVGQRLAHRLADLGLRADVQVEIAEGQVVEFQKAGRGQDDVREVRGVRRKTVDDDREQILPPQGRVQALLLRRGRRGVRIPTHERTAGVGVFQPCGKVHVADTRPLSASQRRSGQPAVVGAGDAGRAVEIVEARARLAHVAGQRGKQPAGAHDVAARGLALQALAGPQQRGAGSVQMRGAFDQIGRHAGPSLAPVRRTVRQQRQDFLRTQRVLGDERVVEQPVALQHVQQAERERGVAARKRLKVQVGLRRGLRPQRIDDDLRSGRFGQPVLVGVRRGVRRVGAPDQDAARVRRGARVEALGRIAEQQTPRHVPGHVADRVRLDLGRPQPMKEAQRKHVRQQRQRAAVVGVQNGLRARGLDHLGQLGGNVREGRVPADALEASGSLRADTAQRIPQAGRLVLPDAVVGDGAFSA